MKKITEYKTIGIMGLAKNTGKTTTLNYLIETYKDQKIGLTSIGLDGEAFDQITFLPKPSIYVYKGMVVATAKKCLSEVDFMYEIVKETKIFTALGEIIIIKSMTPGFLVVAGPTTNNELNQVTKALNEICDLVFIDGALNRKTFAGIDLIDAMIITTGASVNQNMDKTIEATQMIIKSFELPLYDHHQLYSNDAMVFICEKDIKRFQEKDNSVAIRLLKDKQNLHKILYIQGALTESFVDALIKESIMHVDLVIDDATKILLDATSFKYLEKMNIHLFLKKSIKIIALTINPFSPKGLHYDATQFLEEMQKHVSIEVYNIKALKEQKQHDKT